jgi:hypothetical protein
LSGQNAPGVETIYPSLRVRVKGFASYARSSTIPSEGRLDIERRSLARGLSLAQLKHKALTWNRPVIREKTVIDCQRSGTWRALSNCYTNFCEDSQPRRPQRGMGGIAGIPISTACALL